MALGYESAITLNISHTGRNGYDEIAISGELSNRIRAGSLESDSILEKTDPSRPLIIDITGLTECDTTATALFIYVLKERMRMAELNQHLPESVYCVYGDNKRIIGKIGTFGGRDYEILCREQEKDNWWSKHRAFFLSSIETARERANSKS